MIYRGWWLQDEAQREGLKAGKGAGEGASDMEKAADFGRLRTMKVQEATRVRVCPLSSFHTPNPS